MKMFAIMIFACNHAMTACDMTEQVKLPAEDLAACEAMSHNIAAEHAPDAPASSYECRAIDDADRGEMLIARPKTPKEPRS